MRAPYYILCRLFLMLYFGITVIDMDAVLRIQKPAPLAACRIGELAFLVAIYFSTERYRMLKRLLTKRGS